MLPPAAGFAAGFLDRAAARDETRVRRNRPGGAAAAAAADQAELQQLGAPSADAQPQSSKAQILRTVFCTVGSYLRKLAPQLYCMLVSPARSWTA